MIFLIEDIRNFELNVVTNPCTSSLSLSQRPMNDIMRNKILTKQRRVKLNPNKFETFTQRNING